MTLEHCRSTTSVEIIPGNHEVLYFFNAEEKPDFLIKIKKYVTSLIDVYPWLPQYKLIVRSENNFPHSAGIASSASFFASLAFCLDQIHSKLTSGESLDLERISNHARCGSGSAARSTLGPFMSWGVVDGQNGSDDFAQTIDVHPCFSQLQDTIVIIDDSAKSVSSTEGHRLMNEHVFKDARIAQANTNYQKLKDAMTVGDFTTFSKVVIEEALSLHSMMMTSTPSYILMKPNTLALIEILNREMTGRKITYTLDAGPNLHIIYDKSEKDFVLSLLNQNRELYLQVIHDCAGVGAKLTQEKLC
jgi:diphosphomevalonate decarboxylase